MTRTKAELEDITCQLSKDIGKYGLSFPELMICLGWIQTSYGSRIINKTHEWVGKTDAIQEKGR